MKFDTKTIGLTATLVGGRVNILMMVSAGTASVLLSII